MSAELIEAGTLSDKAYNLIARGDLAQLTQEEQTTYYFLRCKSVGLDPNTKPFDLMSQQGKLVMYANAACAQQLCERHNLSTQIISMEATDADTLFQVEVKVSEPGGRATENIGITDIAGLKGVALANAKMKAVTKAKRRTIFDHCGLGMLDETEVADFTVSTPAGRVNTQTGEVVSEAATDEQQKKPTRQETILDALADRQKAIGYEGKVKPLVTAVLGEEPTAFNLATYEKALAKPETQWKLAAEVLAAEAAVANAGRPETPAQSEVSDTSEEGDPYAEPTEEDAN